MSRKMKQDLLKRIDGAKTRTYKTMRSNIPLISKKIRPNDPCPCGKGLKAKHCCGTATEYFYSKEPLKRPDPMPPATAVTEDIPALEIIEEPTKELVEQPKLRKSRIKKLESEIRAPQFDDITKKIRKPRIKKSE